MQVPDSVWLQASPSQLQAYVAALACGHSAPKLAAQMRLGQAAADRVVASITAAFPRLSGFQEGVSFLARFQQYILRIPAPTSLAELGPATYICRAAGSGATAASEVASETANNGAQVSAKVPTNGGQT